MKKRRRPSRLTEPSDLIFFIFFFFIFFVSPARSHLHLHLHLFKAFNLQSFQSSKLSFPLSVNLPLDVPGCTTGLTRSTKMHTQPATILPQSCHRNTLVLPYSCHNPGLYLSLPQGNGACG
jgi:hypothetical protein